MIWSESWEYMLPSEMITLKGTVYSFVFMYFTFVFSSLQIMWYHLLRFVFPALKYSKNDVLHSMQHLTTLNFAFRLHHILALQLPETYCTQVFVEKTHGEFSFQFQKHYSRN